MLVSCDPSPARQAWKEQLGAEYTFASDFWPHGAVCMLYDCLRPQGTPKRAVFIIDKQGVIRLTKEYEKGIPENRELLAELDKINKG